MAKSKTKRQQLKQRARKSHRDSLRWQKTGYSRGLPKGLLPPLTLAARVTEDKNMQARLAEAWRAAWVTNSGSGTTTWRRLAPRWRNG